MEKITLYKKINYYNNGEYINTDTTQKQEFDNIEQALTKLKNCDITYVENKKGVSCYEEIKLLHKIDANNYKQYYKTIDPRTKRIITNVGAVV